MFSMDRGSSLGKGSDRHSRVPPGVGMLHSGPSLGNFGHLKSLLTLPGSGLVVGTGMWVETSAPITVPCPFL